jgi:autotransporter adhesin
MSQNGADIVRNSDDIERNSRGIALAMALKSPFVPLDKKFALSIGVGSFEGESAAALSAAFRATEKVQYEFAIGTGTSGTGLGGRAGMTAVW